MCSSPATSSCRSTPAPNSARRASTLGCGGRSPACGGAPASGASLGAGPWSRESSPFLKPSSLIVRKVPSAQCPVPSASPWHLVPGTWNCLSSRTAVRDPHHRPRAHQPARAVLRGAVAKGQGDAVHHLLRQVAAGLRQLVHRVPLVLAGGG